MYLTVLCQSYILESPFSLLKAFFLLRRTTAGGILEKGKKTNQNYGGNQRQHTERMLSLFNEKNQYPQLFIKSDAFVG